MKASNFLISDNGELLYIPHRNKYKVTNYIVTRLAGMRSHFAIHVQLHHTGTFMRRFYIQEQLSRYILNHDEREKFCLLVMYILLQVIWANEEFVQAG